MSIELNLNLTLHPFEREFLQSFYRKTQGDHWISKDGWNFTEEGFVSLCHQKWEGINPAFDLTLDPSTPVTEGREGNATEKMFYCYISRILLPQHNLNGTLPPFDNLRVISRFSFNPDLF